MTGTEILNAYVDSHDLDKGTVSWLTLVIGRYAKHRGGLLTADDFCANRVNAWLSAMVEAGELSRVTIKSYRRGLLILWRWAFGEKLVAHPPFGVKPIKAPLPVPRGWSAAEVNRFIEQAKRLRGVYNCGIFRADYMVALVRVAWDTGLRLGDLMRLTLADFDEEGNGALVQRKTGYAVLFRLRPSTLAAIEEIVPHGRDKIFGGVVSRTKLFRAVRNTAYAAGLSGGLKKIRKGAASAVERDHPGQAGKFLGHKTPGLAERHYIDPGIARRQPPMPPPLST